MKLHTRPESGIITAEIETANGPRRVSTGTTDPAEAKALLTAAHIHTIEQLAKAGTLTQALIQKLTTGGNLTVPQAIAEWEPWMRESANSDRTADNNAMFVHAWSNTIQKNRKLHTIKPQDLSRWVNADDGTKMASRQVRLAALRHFFRFCSIREYVHPNPALEVTVKAKLCSHEQKEARVKVPFTDAEIVKILDTLTLQLVKLMAEKRTPAIERRIRMARFWYCAVIIGRQSGLRLGDICCLEWASLKDPERLVVWTDKKDTRVDQQASEELLAGIAAIPDNKTRFCFPEQNEISRSNKRAMLSIQFSRILKASGIHNHMFHDLRVSKASAMNAEGKSVEEIAGALGHGSSRSTEIYIKVMPAAA